MKKFYVEFKKQNEDTSWSEWIDATNDIVEAEDEDEAIEIAKDWIADNWIEDETYNDRFDIIESWLFQSRERID